MQNRATAFTLIALTICLVPALVFAMTPYFQDFEGLNPADTAALSNDGWLVFGNVFDSEGGYLYGYGPFPAPNNGAAFCALETGQGGPDQGAVQLSVYSDYENGDHAVGNLIESNVFQEQIIEAGDTDVAWVFEINAKRGNIAGSSTAAAFIKTLDPSSGWALTNFVTVDMTTIEETWGGYNLYLNVTSDMEGQIFQFGFMNTATLYESSGIFYDNINFYQSETIDVPDTPEVVGARLQQNFPNPFNPKTRIEFSVDRPGSVDLSVFDIAGRKVVTLLQGDFQLGDYEATWNGETDKGKKATSGQYWYVLRTPTGQITRGMTLLK